MIEPTDILLTWVSQVFHDISPSKLYSESSEGWLFAEKHLKSAIPLTSDAEVLKFGSDSVKLKGLFIELGVFSGRTINFIAALNPHQKIYGFDSFEGLPEDWKKGNFIIPKGSFALKSKQELPSVLKNVELIKGHFEDTLPRFVNEHQNDGPIAFLHIDSDLYSSAATALTHLAPLIQSGTIIVFDELYNYPGYEQHEYKALEEFLQTRSLKAKYLAYNAYHEQVTLEIQSD